MKINAPNKTKTNNSLRDFCTHLYYMLPFWYDIITQSPKAGTWSCCTWDKHVWIRKPTASKHFRWIKVPEQLESIFCNSDVCFLCALPLICWNSIDSWYWRWGLWKELSSEGLGTDVRWHPFSLTHSCCLPCFRPHDPAQYYTLWKFMSFSSFFPALWDIRDILFNSSSQWCFIIAVRID